MRQINWLLALGIFLSIVAAGGGAALLIMGYGHDDVTTPVWKMGQGWMFQGICNLGIFTALFFMLRKRLKKD